MERDRNTWPDRNTDNKPVICDSCKSSLRVDALSHIEYGLLQGQHCYDTFREELSMLLRVQNLYRRHPEIETIAFGTCMARLRLFEEVEPTYNTAMLSSLADSDFEILEYLRNHAFSLTPRLQFVRERMAQLELYRKAVACPVCKAGKLKLDPSTWINPFCVD